MFFVLFIWFWNLLVESLLSFVKLFELIEFDVSVSDVLLSIITMVLILSALIMIGLLFINICLIFFIIFEPFY